MHKQRRKAGITNEVVPVQVVDGVAPVILDVPAEGGKAHAHIKPRQRHPTDVSRYVSQHRRVHHCQVVEVPATFEVFLPEGHRNEDKSTKRSTPTEKATCLQTLLGVWFQSLTSSAGETLNFPLGMGNPLPNSFEAISAPYSTVTSSSMAPTRRQNSFSTSSVGTICMDKSRDVYLY